MLVDVLTVRICTVWITQKRVTTRLLFPENIPFVTHKISVLVDFFKDDISYVLATDLATNEIFITADE
jgi:hypothetical protein